MKKKKGIKPRDNSSLEGLERREEDRKQAEELDEGKMSEDQYRASLEQRYGKGKWADKLVDEMVEHHTKPAVHKTK